MLPTPTRPIAILGAGLAGLTAAVHLKRHNVPFALFEGANAIAGLCHSQRDEEGFTYDCGVHFITNRLAAAVGISRDCKPMARYGETVYLRERHYSYPFGLMRSPRFAGSALLAKAASVVAKPAVSARDHYRRQYGTRLAEDVAIPLTEAWSGCGANQIAAAVGQKFATSLPRMIMLRASAALTKRVIGIGYAGTITESTDAWHVYPEQGIAAVCQKLSEEVAEDVRLESKVEAIHVEGDSVQGITCNGRHHEVAGVISTAPVHILGKMVHGSDRLAGLKSFRYRAMVFVNLKLTGPSGLLDVVNWMPERDYPFFRVSDIGLGLPWLVPSGKSQITCDIGCQIGDEHWTATDEALTALCLNSLEKLVPGISGRFLGGRVVRVPLAYPIYDLAYEQARQRFSQGTGIRGLVSVGRNGEFAHILMEDVYWRTRWKVTEFLNELR